MSSVVRKDRQAKLPRGQQPSSKQVKVMNLTLQKARNSGDLISSAIELEIQLDLKRISQMYVLKGD